MSSVTKSVRRKIKNVIIDRLFSYSGGDYQRGHEPDKKFELIASGIDMDRVRNVLDIGCNEGKIAARFAKLGKFTVGIDVGPYFLNHVLTDLDNVYGRSSAAYGVFSLTRENVAHLPAFDLILLLSVHHQLIKHHGDEYTKDVVRTLLEKATEYLVIEFAATRMKYGFSGNEFEDNDEASVRSYAESWIHGLADNLDVIYLGKNRESGEREPFRFAYSIRRKA